MAYFGCGLKPLLYKGFSEVERRGQIHQTRLSFMSFPLPHMSFPRTREPISLSVIARPGLPGRGNLEQPSRLRI